MRLDLGFDGRHLLGELTRRGAVFVLELAQLSLDFGRSLNALTDCITSTRTR